MPYRVGSEINTFELAGVDLKSDLRNFTIKVDNDEIDASVITQYANRSQAGMGQLSVDFAVSSATGIGTLCATKVTGLNLTAVGMAGTSYISTFRTVNFTLDTEQDDVSAAADTWHSHQTTAFTLSGDLEVMVPTGVSHAWFAYLNTSAATRNNITFTMTIAGTTITFPVSVMSVEYGNQGKAVTTIKMTVKGFPPCTGVFPTAPTSNTSLLTGFLSDPVTAVNFEFASNATNGEVLDVDVVLKSLSFAIEKNALVETSYSLLSTGNPSNTIA